MALMQTKTCCCGCTLRTGTVFLAVLLMIPSAMLLYDNWTNSRSFEYSTHSSFVEAMICLSCLAAMFACKTDQRYFLLPFMAMVILIFLIMTAICLAVLLAVFGMNAALNAINPSKFVGSISISENRDGSIGADMGFKSGSSFSDSVGPYTIMILIVCLIIISIFWHFVKVVCSLFAEMGNPPAYGRGIIFGPASPTSVSMPLN